jgi:colicin import membrane protein
LNRQLEQKRQAEERTRVEEKARVERERSEREQREQARRQVEQELARQMQEELDVEAAQLRAYRERAKAGRQTRLIMDFKHRIQSKIQSYVRLPHKLTGNPEAVFQVTLLPNGEVARVTLVSSSGQPAYDAEVERAILKASPLPLPAEKDAAAVFRDGLILKFRPSQNRMVAGVSEQS